MSTRNGKLNNPRVVDQWRHRSDRAICAEECRARCCKASSVVLTAAEAAMLRATAIRLGLSEPSIGPYQPPAEGNRETVFVMYAKPCVFLSKNNLCLAYHDRPGHCRAFPQQPLEWCPLSLKRDAASNR
ncbi:MAG: hypothetical protein EXR51_11930 [Dehalococcoidia bacterium]|nr:hypothetical protein [Dehalococcoidia bacterium]